MAVTQWALAVTVVVAALCWLLWGSHSSAGLKASATPAVAPPPANVIGERQISLDRDSTLGKKLEFKTIAADRVEEPLMRVTGSVIACRRPGKNGAADYWQFSSGTLLDTYTSWEKAVADVEFSTAQLGRVKDLAATKEASLTKQIERLEKLVKTGSESERDLANLKTSLLEAQLQGKKDVYEAETAVKSANRESAAFSLQLSQAGLSPKKMLENATIDMDIVAAEVPEGKLDEIAVGQACTAKFFGLPKLTFEGKVAMLSPVLSSEQRTLRVLFVLHDPDDHLRPGMFADIGLGTDPRDVLHVPADSVIHVGKQDYVLVHDQTPSDAGDGKSAAYATGYQSDPSAAQASRVRLVARPVSVRGLIDDHVEVVTGLKPGEEVIGENAILLNPLIVSSLIASGTEAPAIQEAASPGQ
jgi:multidrug efflux pump subunit AcrA (membrane-fusion protein)